MDKIKTILLTGGSGFLGSHLLQAFIDRGYTLIVLLRETSDIWRIDHLKDSFNPYVIKGDDSIKQLFDTFAIDAIVHTATEYGRNVSLSDILTSNVILPLKFIEAGITRGLKLFINTDSFFAKKQYNQTYLNNYTLSKRQFENVLKSFGNNLKIANMRIEHVYGEKDAETKFVTATLKKILENQEKIELTDGIQKRDFVYVKDVAQAYLAVIENIKDINGFEEFEIGTGNSVTVKEFVQKIALSAKSTSVLQFGALPMREGEILDSAADLDTVKKLGWQPAYSMDRAINYIVLGESKRFIK